MISHQKKNKKKNVRLMAILFIVCIGVFFIPPYFIMHSGEQRIKLSTRATDGTLTDVYLKTNGDIVTISKSPKMKLIGEQDNLFVSDNMILYHNTTDTLYIVSFVSDPEKKHNSKHDVVIKYLFEFGYNPELIRKYESLGYRIFPTKAYI